MKRFFRNSLALVLLFTVCINLSACSPVSTVFEILYSVVDIGSNEQVESKYDYNSNLYYSYTQLDEYQQSVYRTICDMLSYYKDEIYLDGISKEELTLIYKAVFDDHPEFFWLTGGISWTAFPYSSKIILYPEFWEYEKPIAECEAEIEEALQNIVSNAMLYNSLYGRVLYVHDYLTENVVYDDDTYAIIDADPYTTENYEYSSAYGALTLNRAICGGYSTAFQLIMQKLGIQCGIVTGDEHEWNFLLLDGEYYYMDITWDCADSDNGEIYAKSYEFFCITEDELLASHSFDDDQFFPECTGTKYDYFVANGYYLDEYDRNSALNIIRSQAGNDYVYIKFGSQEETEKAVDDLLIGSEIFTIPKFYYSELSYFRSMSGLSLTIYEQN